MKTAISLSDELLNDADNAAKELGVSRSRVFAVALEEFLKKRRHRATIERLNAVHGSGSAAGDARVLAGMKNKTRATLKDCW